MENNMSYARKLISAEYPSLSEEETTVMVNKLIADANKQVARREKVRERKAIERGIDLTKTRIVSKDAYDWYTTLSPDEHQKLFGFQREKRNSKFSKKPPVLNTNYRIPKKNIVEATPLEEGGNNGNNTTRGKSTESYQQPRYGVNTSSQWLAPRFREHHIPNTMNYNRGLKRTCQEPQWRTNKRYKCVAN